ncbi:MAG: VanZ family protein [Clostridium sp.]
MRIVRDRKLIRAIVGVLVIVWMGFIFYNSSQTSSQSNGLSKSITEKVNDNIVKKVPGIKKLVQEKVKNLNIFIRKFAHFFQFMILAILVSLFLGLSNVSRGKIIIFALGLVVIYAGLDEFHQLFVDGRSGQLKDIFIDSFGGLTGITIYQLFHMCIMRLNMV